MNFEKQKKLHINTNREKIIKKQNSLEEINALVLCRIISEGEDSYIYLENNPGVRESEELYYDAMKKLVKVIVDDKNKNIKKILKVFEKKDKYSDLFSGMGFNIFYMNKYFPLVHRILTLDFKKLPKKQEVIATISRDDFLNNFAK